MRTLSALENESGTVAARWEDASHSVVLYRTSSYRDSYRLLITDTRLEAVARTAEAQATRLDAQEAPARELARQKKELDDSRAAGEKARAVNKGGFRP